MRAEPATSARRDSSSATNRQQPLAPFAGAHNGETVRALGYNLSGPRFGIFALGTSLAVVPGVIIAPVGRAPG
jgi:hypothetical protein